ncbi:MAG: hypothetical protein KBD10_01785 [Candidatus Pacebacteria bacterium]|nr:hypothetical protein [Candidatus Paceibacterota bacterium]
MILRLIITVLLVLFVFVIPWWLSFILVIAASFYFKNFYEAVFVALIMDSIFGSVSVFGNFPYVLTLIFLVLIFIVNKIREKLIMY